MYTGRILKAAAVLACLSGGVAGADDTGVQVSLYNGQDKSQSTVSFGGAAILSPSDHNLNIFDVSPDLFSSGIKKLYCEKHLDHACYTESKPVKSCKKPYEASTDKEVLVKLVPVSSKIQKAKLVPITSQCVESNNTNAWPVCGDKDNGNPGSWCEANPTYDTGDCNCTANNNTPQLGISLSESGSMTVTNSKTFDQDYSGTVGYSAGESGGVEGSFTVSLDFSKTTATSKMTAFDIAYSNTNTITVEPGVTRFDWAFYNQVDMQVKVDYEASLGGVVAGMYSRQCEGHYFRYGQVAKVLKHASGYDHKHLTQTFSQVISTQGGIQQTTGTSSNGTYSSCEEIEADFIAGKLTN